MDRKNNIYQFPVKNTFLSKAKQLLGEAEPREYVQQHELIQELMERVARLERILKNAFLALIALLSANPQSPSLTV